MEVTWRRLCGCVVLALFVHSALSWRQDYKPRIFGDKIPRKVLLPHLRRVQRKIVLYHNYFRSHVSPPAADMLRMTWHKGAARAAQRWSEQCLYLTHDDLTGRWVDNYGSCGQNIFISTQQVPWYFAIKMWFMERHNFTYASSRNDLHVVGHYTQMVWAATHKVGCGFTKCGTRGRHYYSYVCNYCPMGNHMERLGTPYKKGRPCAKCPHSCKAKKLCTNGCNAADLWANCKELNATWHDWLCKSPDKSKNCKATCNCNGRIF